MALKVDVYKRQGYHMGQRTDAKLPFLETFIGDSIDVVDGIVGQKVGLFLPACFQIFHQCHDDIADVSFTVLLKS